ncbi:MULTISPECIES: hypothetical protein [Micromonospora]|uniref:Uncharacterized protein n=1 Tax=Micromonospora solifontis TaxID=2487138 RepID=A0ABX9W8E4_9ACTN|nr:MULTISPECIES: hypothetical protein [Micromonospora]NES16275.1 hypothetical protein [Micromonospora sp. PPF5-17B]NES39688.1 hypothetical protein [Micromonospora solifontis]NES59074.1 hypothetical protein [Micromonospora sp. PPF5-6]RNL87118.1 hypothetical protein EFE23_26820 [Micromonospora solifontis]
MPRWPTTPACGPTEEPEAASAAIAILKGHTMMTASTTRDAMLPPNWDHGIAPMAAAVIGARARDDRVPQRWGSRLRSSLQIWTVAGELAELINPKFDAGCTLTTT